MTNTTIREPAIAYARNTEIPTFFGQPLLRGRYADLAVTPLDIQTPAQFYSHPNGEIWVGDVVAWLCSLPSESADLIFADPPYNIGKAEWDTFESQQAYVEWSLRWIEQAARVLKPTGTLYICGFSEILADLRLPAAKFFQGCRWLVWHYKNKEIYPMTVIALGALQESVRDKLAFKKLDDYLAIGRAFLSFLQQERPTRIVSPTQSNYIFSQSGPAVGRKITRSLNTIYGLSREDRKARH